MIEECFFTNKHFSDINPLGVGYQKCSPNHSCGPQQRDYYAIHYIISGEGILRMNHKTYRIHENQMFIFPPDTTVYYQASADNPWEYTWLLFDGECAKLLDCLSSPVLEIDYKYFKDLLDCKNYPGTEAEYLISRIWLIFSYLFCKKSTGDYVAIAKEYITCNYMTTINLEHMAHSMGISRKYLSRIFKEVTGQTMREFLNDIRFKKALTLLVDSHYNVRTVASLVGFDDSTAFSKFFKRHDGHSPKYYLKKKQSKDF